MKRPHRLSFLTHALLFQACLFLACIAPSANAQPVDRQIVDRVEEQVRDQMEDQVREITRDLEPVTDSVQEEVRRAAEEEVSAQRLLERDLSPERLLKDEVSAQHVLESELLPEKLMNDELSAGQALDKGMAPQRLLRRDTEHPLTNRLTHGPRGLAAESLPKALPIVNRSGQTQFVEVVVEGDWRAVEREWLVLVDHTDLTALAAVNADILELTTFSELGLKLVRFRVAAVWDSLAALKRVLPAHLHEQLDRNHIYVPQARASSPAAPRSEPLRAMCTAPVRIGMIDTAVDTAHPAFAQSRIEARDFAGPDFVAPRTHGTAVAGVLVGAVRGKGNEDQKELSPLLPAATLYAASVFYPRGGQAQGATMINLVRALNWLAGQQVAVINMSLAGPDNKILGLAIRNAIQSGISVVAAAGNEGPAAPPSYPAAYPEVIAVTAVDSNQTLYRWANRGDYIDFAALGVKVLTARSAADDSASSPGSLGIETGTSMAAPVVTAAVACAATARKGDAPITSQLIEQVKDLGAPGRDPLFGYGLINR